MELVAARPTVTSLELTPKQATIVDAVLTGDCRYVGLGGAIRGSKTFTVLILLSLLMRIFPRSRWAIVREDWTALQQNTMPSVEKVRATMGGWLGPFNHSTRAYTAANGSQLLLVPESITQDPDLKSFHGFEVNGFLLEEGNELAHKTFHKAIERAGAWVIDPDDAQRIAGDAPEQPPPFVFVTFNPSDEWTDTVFHEPAELGTLAPPYAFFPLRITDNPYLPQPYLDSLEELRHADPDGYARFVEGKRGAITQPNQLIQSAWLIAARTVAHAPGPLREAVDVARYGDDETVFARLDGNALVELEPHAKWGIDETTERAKIRLAEHRIDADRYVVDTDGMGGGVADYMHAAGLRVRGFTAGGRPVERPGSFYTFKNLRSQAWWELREKFRTGRLRLAVTHPTLVKDLTAPRYTIGGDRMIEVESKDTIKKRIGRSTDYADALVMAAFDWPVTTPDDLDPRHYRRAGYATYAAGAARR